MSVSPNCDSDEEMFWGPVTAKELEREWRLRKLKRRAFSPNDARFAHILCTSNDESPETEPLSTCVEKKCSDLEVEIRTPESMGKISSKNKTKWREFSTDQKENCSNYNESLCPINRDIIIAGDYSLISSEEEQECNDSIELMIPESPEATPPCSLFSNKNENFKVETPNNREYLGNGKESPASFKDKVKNIDLENSKVVGDQDEIEVAGKEIYGFNDILDNNIRELNLIALKDQNDIQVGAENLCKKSFNEKGSEVSFIEENKNLERGVSLNEGHDSVVILDNQPESKEIKVKDGIELRYENMPENIFNMKESGVSNIEEDILNLNNIDNSKTDLHNQECPQLKEITVSDFGLVVENTLSHEELGISLVEHVNLKGGEIFGKEIHELDFKLACEKTETEFKDVEKRAEKPTVSYMELNVNFNGNEVVGNRISDPCDILNHKDDEPKLKELKCDDAGIGAENVCSQKESEVKFIEECKIANLKEHEVTEKIINGLDDIVSNGKSQVEFKKDEIRPENLNENSFQQEESQVSCIESNANMNPSVDKVAENDICNSRVSSMEVKKIVNLENEVAGNKICSPDGIINNEDRKPVLKEHRSQDDFGIGTVNAFSHKKSITTCIEELRNMDLIENEVTDDIVDNKCQKDNNVEKILDFRSLCIQNKGVIFPEPKHVSKDMNYREKKVLEINEPSPIKKLNNVTDSPDNNISSCKFMTNKNLLKPAKIILSQSPSNRKKIPISSAKLTIGDNSPKSSVILANNSVSNPATNLPTVANIDENKITKLPGTGSNKISSPRHMTSPIPQKHSPTSHKKTRTLLKSPVAVKSLLKPASANLTPAKPLNKMPSKLRIPVPITTQPPATGMKQSAVSKPTGLKPPTPMKPQMSMTFSALNKPSQSTTSFTPIKGNALFKHPTPVRTPTPKKTNMIGKEIRSPVADYIHKSPTLIYSQTKNIICQENQWPSENIDSTNIQSTEDHIKPLHYSASKKKIEIKMAVKSQLPVMGERQRKVFTSPKIIIKNHLTRVKVPNSNKEDDMKDPSRPSYLELPSDGQIGDCSVLLCKGSGL